MSKRDEAELFNAITAIDLPDEAYLLVSERSALAKGLIAAGWRPPARTVSAVEELDALPLDSAVLDRSGDVYTKGMSGWWLTAADEADEAQDLLLVGPVVVLYEGDA